MIMAQPVTQIYSLKTVDKTLSTDLTFYFLLQTQPCCNDLLSDEKEYAGI